MKRELKKRFVWLLSVVLGMTCLGCVRPSSKVKPIKKVSKKKGGW